MPLRRFGPVLLLVTLVACGGGDDDTPPTLPPPSTPPPAGSPSQNPCVAALAQAEADGEPFAPSLPATSIGKGRLGLAADKRHVADLLWRSALAARATNRAAPAPDAVSQDIGDIAVIEDDGTLLLARNSFDVRNVGLRFERNGSGGYDVTQTTAIVPHVARPPHHADRRRLEERDHPVRVLLLRALVHLGVRQLGRQPDVRGGRRGVDRPAASRACSAGRRAWRRSSPISIRRPAAASSSTPRPTPSPSPGAASAASTRRRRRRSRRRCSRPARST